MFDRQMFHSKIIEKGMTIKDISVILGIRETTLYRKMNGISDFTRNEIQLFREKLNLSADETDAIFFAKKLT